MNAQQKAFQEQYEHQKKVIRRAILDPDLSVEKERGKIIDLVAEQLKRERVN